MAQCDRDENELEDDHYVLDLGNFGSAAAPKHQRLPPCGLGAVAVGFMRSCSTALRRGDHRGKMQHSYSYVANLRRAGQGSGFTSLTVVTDPPPGGREDYGELTAPTGKPCH